MKRELKMAPICPHCGNNQVSEWPNTETSNGGIGNRSVRYFCQNCKKDFTVTETRQYAPGMTWLVTFDSNSPLGDFDAHEFYCNSNGAIYLHHHDKMCKVFSLIITPNYHIKYRWSGDNREHMKYTDCSIIRMNSELTKQACEKEVFFNIYSQRGDCFSLYSYKAADPQCDEIALFLNGVLCTQETASEGCCVAGCDHVNRNTSCSIVTPYLRIA